MSDFIILAGGHSFEHVNLDLVRRITEDMDGNITLHFDSTDKRVLQGQEAKDFKNAFDRRWREKVEAALA